MINHTLNEFYSSVFSCHKKLCDLTSFLEIFLLYLHTKRLKQNTTLSNMNIILKIMSNHIDTRYHKTRHFVSTCTVINFYSIFHSAVKTFFRSSKSSQHWSFLRILMHFLVLFLPTGTVNSARPR